MASTNIDCAVHENIKRSSRSVRSIGRYNFADKKRENIVLVQKLSMFAFFLMVAVVSRSEVSDLDVLGDVGELRPGLLEGFLHGQPVLNSAAFIPAPPNKGTALEMADVACSIWTD